MAAKKQEVASATPSNKAPGKPTDKPAAKNGKRKKVSKPAKKRPLKPLPRLEDLDPEVLANLAVSIMQLGGATEAAPETKPVRLATPVMHDALDDARRLLLAAKGLIDEEVDAYRIFSEDDGLMSYDDIAARFNRYGWRGMTARNTVERIILELVESAEKAVQKEMEKHDALCSARCNYPGGVYGLAARMKERIREAIGDVELEVLLSDPDRVAEAMGQVFLRLMEKDITGDWEVPWDEEAADTLGFTTFIKYVCGGMTYEQFMPEGENVRMDYDRLACLGHFLKGADAWLHREYKDRAKDLGILIRIFRGQGGGTALLVHHLNACLEELRRTPPVVETVKGMVEAANAELGKFCERMHLAHLVAVQGWRPMALQIQSILSIDGCQQSQAKGLKVVLDLIEQAEESVRNPNFEPAKIRVALTKLHEQLTQTSSRLRTCGTFLAIAEEVEKVAEKLDRSLRAERVKPVDMDMAVENLIHDLKPSKEARRCRPYELFLFAAQNGLCREELVRQRSELAPGVVTAPAHRSSLSILVSHRGAEIAFSE